MSPIGLMLFEDFGSPNRRGHWPQTSSIRWRGRHGQGANASRSIHCEHRALSEGWGTRHFWGSPFGRSAESLSLIYGAGSPSQESCTRDFVVSVERLFKLTPSAAPSSKGLQRKILALYCTIGL